MKIVNMLEKAKIVYSTATPASQSLHLGLMNRLGIWGPSKYFKNFHKFYDLVHLWYVLRKCALLFINEL